MRVLSVFLIVLAFAFVHADEAAQAPKAEAAISRDGEILAAISGVSTKQDEVATSISAIATAAEALGAIQKAQDELASKLNSVESTGAEVLAAVKSQSGGNAQTATGADSSSEVLAKVNEVQTAVAEVATSATANGAALSEFSTKVAASLSEITAQQQELAQSEQQATESHRTAQATRLAALEAEIREMKTLLQSVLASVGAEDRTKSGLDRLLAAQDRILERLDGGVLDSIGKALACVQTFTAEHFDQVTVFAKGALVSLKAAAVDGFSNSDEWLAKAQAMFTQCSKCTQKFVLKYSALAQDKLTEVQGKLVVALTAQGVPAEYAPMAAWSAVGMASFVAVVVGLVLLSKVLKFVCGLICGALCCGNRAKNAAAATTKAAKKGKKKST